MSYRIKRRLTCNAGPVKVTLQYRERWMWKTLGTWYGAHAEFSASQYMLRHDELKKPLIAYGDIYSGKFIVPADGPGQ